MPEKLTSSKKNAEVVGLGGAYPFTIKTESHSRKPANEFRKINDLSELEQVTLQNVLDCLVERYTAGIFYTYAGSMLISLNPCKPKSRNSFPDEDYLIQFKQYDFTRNSNHYPHVFSVAEKCLKAMRDFGNSQVVVVSGDSGAGKTTLTQQLLCYLINESNRIMEMKIPNRLDKEIYFATLILESLGNASTTSNSNSSRFGRFIKLNYDVNSSCIVGAKLRTCLLEKHRVSKFAKTERNFHIFYYILIALENGLLRLSDILSNSETNEPVDWKNQIPRNFLEGIAASDENEFQTLHHSLQSLKLTSELENIFRIVYGIMMLINIHFVPLEEENSLIEDDTQDNKVFVPEEENIIRIIGDIFSVPPDELANIFISRTITVHGGRTRRQSIFHKPCNSASECEARVAAFTSSLYNALFHHMIAKLNSLFKFDARNEEFDDRTLKMETISLLDLYGFENLVTNHLEQLCINYANERLQLVQLQVLKIFANEIEDLEIGFVLTELNKIETESLERLQSIHETVFLVLNEACLLNRKVPEMDVFQRLTSLTTRNKFIESKIVYNANCPFLIKHYATEVQYTFSGMVAKNSDNTPSEFQELFSQSTNPFLQNLFNGDGEEPSRKTKVIKGGGNKREKTILQRFKVSVDELVTELSTQETHDTHFIRCIRPNDNLTFGKISTTVVEKQLFSSGIVDVIRITGSGYPIRILQSKFRDNFPGIMTLLFPNRCSIDVTTTTEIDVLNILGFSVKDMRIGHTKIFLTEVAYEFLKRLEPTLIRRCVTRLQRNWKMVMKRRHDARKRKNTNWLHVTAIHGELTTAALMNPSTIASSADISPKHVNIINALIPTDVILEKGNSGLIPSVQHTEIRHPFQVFRTITFDERCRIMENLNLRSHEGILTRGQLSKNPVRFHTRKTALAFSHCQPKCQGLSELLI